MECLWRSGPCLELVADMLSVVNSCDHTEPFISYQFRWLSLGGQPISAGMDMCCAARLQQIRWSIRKVFLQCQLWQQGPLWWWQSGKIKGRCQVGASLQSKAPSHPEVLECWTCTVPLRRSSVWQTHRWQAMWSVLCHSQLTGTPLKLCPPPFQGHEQTGMAVTHQGQQQDTEGRAFSV